MSVPKSKLVPESVKNLTERLPRGYAKLVVSKLSERDVIVTEDYVRCVKRGNFFNEDVVNELFKVADDEDERKVKDVAEQIALSKGKKG